MNWQVERVTKADLNTCSGGATSGSLHPALEAVRQELFAEVSPVEFQNRYLRLLATDGCAVAQEPGVTKRGAEAYWIRGNQSPVAVLLIHFYGWSTLAPQICFKAERDSGSGIVDLALARFEDLVRLRTPLRLAAELASFWVVPTLRRQGLGARLFEKYLEVIGRLLHSGDLAFTAVRGELGKEKGQAIFQHLLACEERANGRDPETGVVRITGISVSPDALGQALGFDCRYLRIHPASRATAILAEKSGMEFLGYFRTTSTLYGKLWP